MMKRPIQFFSTEYLEHCKSMSPEQIAKFIEEFRNLHRSSSTSKKRLISLRISETLLNAAKSKAEMLGIPYQTQIQRLIESWVKS